MDYIERNRVVIAEIGRDLRLQKGELIRTGSHARFTPVGNYNSALLGTALHVGLKENPNRQGEHLKRCAARELALIRLVEQSAKHLLPEFPIFYGVLENAAGEPVGVLMEDFSQGGRYKVEDVTRSSIKPILDIEVPKELETIAGRKIDNYDLATMCFMVNGQRRIGDFDEMYSSMLPEELSHRYLISDLIDEKFTLRISYPL